MHIGGGGVVWCVDVFVCMCVNERPSSCIIAHVSTSVCIPLLNILRTQFRVDYVYTVCVCPTRPSSTPRGRSTPYDYFHPNCVFVCVYGEHTTTTHTRIYTRLAYVIR